MQSRFPPMIRGMAVAAVLAAVMSTTDALLLACSSSISHDLLGRFLQEKTTQRMVGLVRVGTAWAIGILALYWAYSPPELISQFYTAGVGLLSGSLFVPVIAGLWWKRANRLGGVLALLAGALTYVLVQLQVLPLGIAPILVALAASTLAMAAGALLGRPDSREMLAAIERLHAP
jgi:Na+/proline symporter